MLAPGSHLGPYEILAPLGAGGMGEVYKARDPRLSRLVAVKVMPVSAAAEPDRLRRFEQEARAAGALNHPGVLAIYDVGLHDGVPYVVSELLEGETLRERLKGGPLGTRKVVELATQIAQGLAAAHERGIVHRDLKPENLFLTRDGRAKILDFGLAKLSEPALTSSEDSPTAAIGSPSPGSTPGAVLGTVGYMSPEQVRAQPVDARSDIFSLGAILYEMLSGQRAFQRDSAVETMSAILRDEPQELPHSIPPGFDRIVRHCLEKNPEERFQSARDLAFNLQALSGLSTVSGAAYAALPAERRWRPGLPWLAVPVVVLALLGAYRAGRGKAAPVAPSYQPLTFERGAVLSARFAPDGQTIVYGAAWNGHPVQVYTARPGSPESRPLGLEGASLLGISPNGEMALSLKHRLRGGFQFSGTLARAPLAGGAPREVLEDVYEAAWAPDGERLAVVRQAAGRDRLEFPSGTVLYETAGWLSHPRVAPDGSRVAFLDHPHFPEDTGSVAVVDLTGRKTTLSDGWQSAQGLAWSPDGREIWFSAAERGKHRGLHAVDLFGRARLLARVPGRLTLHDVSADGRALVTRDSLRFETAGLAPGGEAERDLTWLDGSMSEDLSLDGRTLLFYEGGEAGGERTGVYVRGTDGTPAVRLGDGLPTELSPDGKWALTLQRASTPQLMLLPTGPGEPRKLGGHGFSDLLAAHWLADGRRFVLNAVEPGKGLRSYLLDVEGGKPRAVTPEGDWAQDVAPDGSAVVAAGDRKLMLWPLDGSPARPVAGSGPGDRAAQWSADGGSIYVYRRHDLPCRVHRIDLATGTRELWREFRPADPAGVVATQEVQITPDGRAYAYSYVRLLSELYLVEGLR